MTDNRKTPLKEVSIIEQIRGNDNILSLPQVLSEVLEEVGKENFTADSLARIILKDPSLTGRILKIANSSFYQRMTEIKTVHQAVSLLGITTVKCLALSSSVFNPDKVAMESGVDPKAFFSYVLSVSSASEKIAKAISLKAPEEAFIAGLLHDIGVLFLLHHHPERYAQIINGQQRASSLVEAEKAVFGVDHCEIGFHLAETWRLPDYVVASVAHHHHPKHAREADVLPSVVAMAALLTTDRWSGFEIGLEDRLSRISELAEQLSLTKAQVDEISSSLLSGTIDAAEYLGVDIGDIEQMLVRANQEIWKSYLTIENLFKERQELSQNLLEEERAKGALEAKNISLATLSHYLNNAIMAIYGRTQIQRMMLDKGETKRLIDTLKDDLNVMDKSMAKIVAVLAEMRDISPVDEEEFFNMSKAMRLDDRIQERMARMSADGSWADYAESATTS